MCDYTTSGRYCSCSFFLLSLSLPFPLTNSPYQIKIGPMTKSQGVRTYKQTKLCENIGLFVLRRLQMARFNVMYFFLKKKYLYSNVWQVQFSAKSGYGIRYTYVNSAAEVGSCEVPTGH